MGCSVVTTGHLLLAAMTDPAVRWAFRIVGVERADVENEVVRAAGEQRRPRPRPEGITPLAAEAVMQSSRGSSGLDEARPDAAEIAEALRTLALRFLVRTRHSDARAILDGHDDPSEGDGAGTIRSTPLPRPTPPGPAAG